jgi:hypothetical protein
MYQIAVPVKEGDNYCPEAKGKCVNAYKTVKENKPDHL